MPRRLAVLVGACVLLAAGCGDDAERTATPPAATAASPAAGAGRDERAIRATLQRYAAAVRAGDAELICAKLLAPEMIATVKEAGGDCARDLMAARIAEAGPDYALDVRSVRITGDRALAATRAVETDGTRVVRQPLVRVGRDWRLST
jgi:ketosteroid isomerase-like protein